MLAFIALFFPAAIMVVWKRRLFKEDYDWKAMLVEYIAGVVLINFLVIAVARIFFANKGNIINNLNTYNNFALKYILLSVVLAFIIPIFLKLTSKYWSAIPRYITKIERQKARQVYVLCLVSISAIILLSLTYTRLKDNDYFDKSTTTAGYIDLTDISEDDVSGDDYVLYAEGFQQIYFYSGTYEITVKATTTSDDAYCQVIDLWTNTVLAEFDYAIGNNTNEICFTTEENFENVVIRSYVATDDIVAAINGQGDISELLKISSYTMKSDGAVCSDAEWTIIFFLLIFILIGYGIYRMVFLRKPALLMVTLMALVTSLPFFNDYLPSGHDWKFHISRIFSLGESFMDGQIPQHMNVSMATADITPSLYPELVLYFAGFLCAAGATAWFGYQVTYILITFLTAFTAYYSARQMSGQRTALMFTFIYLANPYRLNDIFVRAAIGEAFGMAFLPLIVVGMWKVLCCPEKEDHKKGATDLVLGYTGVISAHVIMSIISAYVCAMIVIIVFLAHPMRFVKRAKRMLWIISAAVLTVLINLWFLVPFLQFFGLKTKISSGATTAKMQYTTPYLWQVFMGVTSQASDLGNTKSAAAEMSLTIGFALLVGLILFILMNLRDMMHLRENGIVIPEGEGKVLKQPSLLLSSDEKRIGGLSLLIATIFLYMSSPYFPWEWMCETFEFVTLTIGRIQFSWRLLSVVAFMLSVVLVIVLQALHRQKNKYSPVISGMILVICLFSAVSAGTHYFSDGASMTDKFSASYKIYSDYELSWADNGEIESWYLSGEGPYVLTETDDDEADVTVTDYHRDGTNYYFSFKNNSDEEITITVPVLWYGLHTAYLTDEASGEKTVLNSSMNTTLQFTDIVLPGGSSGTVSLEYSKPLKWSLADLISIIALLAFIGVLIYDRRKHRIAACKSRKAGC